MKFHKLNPLLKMFLGALMGVSLGIIFGLLFSLLIGFISGSFFGGFAEETEPIYGMASFLGMGAGAMIGAVLGALTATKA